MKFKTIGSAVLAVVALMAFTETASATTLEVGGVKQTAAVTIQATIAAGTSMAWTLTDGSFVNTAVASTFEVKTSTSTTGTVVSGPVATWTWSGGAEGEPITDERGSLSIENISGTTKGTLRSNGTKVTVPSPLGTITCTTSNTDIGTLIGAASGKATLAINAVLNCGSVVPSVKWSGTYTVTSPLGLGVTS